MTPKGKFYATVDYGEMPRLKSGLDVQLLYVKEQGLRQAVQRLLRILRAVPSASIILLDSTSGRLHPDMVAAALISLLPRRYRPHLVLMGAMWNQNSGIRDRVDRFILSFANRAIQRYIVQSREELTVFPETWHIDPGKVRYCHYFYTLIDSELEYEAYSDEIYIFAGGNAHRDYEPLLEAARRMPDHKFIVASRLHFPDVSSNVIIESVPHEQFVRLMIGASVVVTPIKSGLSRAAGQQTYLNAMRLGKVSIVNGNDIFGVREYIEHGKNGLIVDGTPEGYVAAFEWVFDPANRAAVEAMQLAAKQHVQDTFTYENHVACIVEIIDELLETA